MGSKDRLPTVRMFVSFGGFHLFKTRVHKFFLIKDQIINISAFASPMFYSTFILQYKSNHRQW